MDYMYTPLIPASYDIRLVTLLPGPLHHPLRINLTTKPLLPTPQQDSHRLPLGELRKSLPDGWEVHETLEGRIAFHHSALDEVSWDHPVPSFERALYRTSERDDSPLSPSYEALSYVWGSSDMSAEVIIVSMSDLDELQGIVRITANLDAALRHLRFEDRPRTLWIDAICINQGDLNERSEQVQRMAHIYTQAQRVVVWLGEASSDSKLALERLCHLGRQNIITKSNFGFRAPEAEHPDWWLPSFDIPFDDDTWKAISSLLDRAWFQRLWVFQEIQLASPRAVLQCGQDEGSWADLRASILCLKEKNQTFLPEVVSNLRKHFMLCLDWRGESFPLMMNSVRRRLCSDERDLVYALLGLMTPMFASLIRPNYRLPAREVYKDVFLAHVRATQRLELISYCGRGAELGSPTWVPNWVVRDQYDPNRGLASGISPAVFSTPTPDILEVSGVSCGRISHVGSLAEGEADERVEMARTWYRECISWLEESGFQGNADVSFRDAFASMLLEGGVGDVYPEIIGVSCRQWREKWVAYCEKDRKISVDDVMADPEFFRCAQLIIWSRFVATAEGYIGLVPRATQPGDTIAVFLGSNTPVVLRPEGDRHFAVIGSCYVHGLMHSEGVLGRFPPGWKGIFLMDENGLDRPCYRCDESDSPDGTVTTEEDPRLGPVPPPFERVASQRTPDDPTNFVRFRNCETGEVVNYDPRLTPEALRGRGVNVETFHLV
ncbi:HET-domain-containing protein [Aspergillus candidus]|uniref:HET-domain-containing protein n=1 Tax=Aspergillus candidus TaxID=41067 RepID=A0A2I2F0X3_ASPCN|nr:HET-domain-containing protein [Aspergillus candidus]PLB34246.1 HET-domain-containing protein [Aspergillus candidus]